MSLEYVFILTFCCSEVFGGTPEPPVDASSDSDGEEQNKISPREEPSSSKIIFKVSRLSELNEILTLFS